MEAVRIKASPKQLSKLRNGHKVSVKPAMEGEGLVLVIDPSQYNQISKTFSKGKGKVISLSPEEIMANREIGGEGIFSTLKKVGSAVAKNPIAKSLAKTAIDTAVQSAGASGYVPPSVAKSLGKMAKSKVDGAGLMDMAKSALKSKVGKSLASKAVDMAVASASKSGYVPPSVAKAIGAEAKKKVAGMGILDTLKKGAKAVAKSKIGKSLAKTAIDTAVASAGASGYVPPSVAQALGKSAKSSVDGYGIWSGGGDHSGGFGGMGLYAGRRTYGGGMSGGALLNVSNSHLPPALQSQNLSANFAFSTQLPPALAQMK